MSLNADLAKHLSEARKRSFVQWFATIAAALIGASLFNYFGPAILNWLFDRFQKEADPPNWRNLGTLVPLTMLGAMLGAFLGSFLVRTFEKLGEKWDELDQAEKVTIFVGIFVGLIVAVPFITLLNTFNLERVTVALMVVGLAIGASAIAIYAMQTMTDVLPWYKGKGRTRRTGIKILDTNVIIDGRIYDVARTGFIEGKMYVPGFVLEELQYIADSHDGLRRQRGRRGLEVLRLLQSEFQMEVRVHDKLAPAQGDDVDNRLVRLAKVLGGDLVTNDHNLNRVAALQDVRVLNINDLALSLRPNVLPQEHLTISIIREGNQPGQGVGYLDDGTMVVVEGGRNHIGETMEITVTQVIQTERGKLIFGEVNVDNTERRSRSRRNT